MTEIHPMIAHKTIEDAEQYLDNLPASEKHLTEEQLKTAVVVSYELFLNSYGYNQTNVVIQY